MSKINVIKVGTNEGDVKLTVIENELRAFQEYVEGDIEICPYPYELYERGLRLICNEEGLIQQLDCNLNLFPFFIVGNALIVAVDGEEIVSLDSDQAFWARAWVESLPKL